MFSTPRRQASPCLAWPDFAGSEARRKADSDPFLLHCNRLLKEFLGSRLARILMRVSPGYGLNTKACRGFSDFPSRREGAPANKPLTCANSYLEWTLLHRTTDSVLCLAVRERLSWISRHFHLSWSH